MISHRRPAANRILSLFRIFTISAGALRTILRLYDRDPKGSNREIRVATKKWSDDILSLMGGHVRVHGSPVCVEPCLYVGNHVGFMDIVVTMNVINKSFVSKKEVQKWPIFGKGQMVLEGVFVDRSSAANRNKVAETIAHAIQVEKKSIVLFPEGTSSLVGKDWKRGAFVMAKRHNFKVQPFRLAYKPARLCAYFGADNFILSLWKLLGIVRFDVDVEFFEPQSIADADVETREIQAMIQASYAQQMSLWGEQLAIE
jgi:1-acyl-sn-glycerol-3-phosphate acyltransferase